MPKIRKAFYSTIIIADNCFFFVSCRKAGDRWPGNQVHAAIRAIYKQVTVHSFASLFLFFIGFFFMAASPGFRAGAHTCFAAILTQRRSNSKKAGDQNKYSSPDLHELKDRTKPEALFTFHVIFRTLKVHKKTRRSVLL